MSKIIIIGAGAMGSAFALPCIDNKHDINIVGTHLENDFIDSLKEFGFLKGCVLGLKRILSCHPIKMLGGGSGFDPVKKKRN